jgi:exosortase/archaeosortase family protein
MMLVVSTLVLCYLLLRSVWGRAAVILAAVPFSIAKNGLRVFTLAVLGRYVDRGYLTGSLHHNGGPLFFALALAMVFGLIGLLRWIERETDQLPATEHPRKSRSRSVADFSTLTSAEPDHACEVKR